MMKHVLVATQKDLPVYALSSAGVAALSVYMIFRKIGGWAAAIWAVITVLASSYYGLWTYCNVQHHAASSEIPLWCLSMLDSKEEIRGLLLHATNFCIDALVYFRNSTLRA